MDEKESQAATGYEFTVPQNVIIQKTATYAKLWGIISIVLGAIQILVGQLPGGSSRSSSGWCSSGLRAP